MATTNEINWPESVWQEINEGVMREVSKVRIAQKVFPTSSFTDNPTQVADEVINFGVLTISEGATKPYTELFAEFSLTSTQVQQEPIQHVCRTLAIMAAKALALAEDRYFYQLSNRAARRDPDPANSDVKFEPPVKIVNWRTNLDFGLLADANPAGADDSKSTEVSKPITVELSIGGNATWGENTFEAVTKGISLLIAKTQAPNYALVLPTTSYADTFVPPSNASLVTTADRIRPLVEGGFYTSGVLPPDEGLLVALGGEPVKLYVGREATTEFVRKEGANYFFRVVERVQYVVRDPRALVLLKFVQPAGVPAAKAKP
ncbi:MAG: encapsulin [Acidobacteria bacterium]|nr:encapsulin [Acidobacteriota bacterium]